MRQWNTSSVKVVPDQQRVGPPTAPDASMLSTGSRASAPIAGTSKLGNLTKRQLVKAAFNWSLCLLLLFLMLSQLLTVGLSASAVTLSLFYGRSPITGKYAIPGFNDEPYSDRLLVCHRKRRHFEITSINEALCNPDTIVEDTNGTNVDGYRVVKRAEEILDDATKTLFTKTCSMINSTLEYMITVCNALGYSNLSRDTLRIVDDVHSSRLYRIPNSLPVLIMPFWDNAPTARYAIPGLDGHACMFRLAGRYEIDAAKDATLYAVNRSVRESKTIEWLGRPDGRWKNGWYEDTNGVRWYSDVVSTNPSNVYDIMARGFDMLNKRELNYQDPSERVAQVAFSRWGSSLLMMRTSLWSNSVAISNGSRYGLFLFEANDLNVVTCVYDIATFISDMSTITLLMQWMLSMVAAQRGFFKGVGSWHNIDIGCLANSFSFGALPITMIPRLKMIITAFYVVGCEFEGDQRALSYSWFVIYPSIVQIVLIYGSLVNILARILRRRMSSMQIPVTIVFFSIMHWSRLQIGASNMFGFDGRISTIVQPDEFEAMSLLDVLKPSVAMRLAGNISSLLFIKVSLLLLNTLPLFFSQDMSIASKKSQAHRTCASEKALSVRACNVGGVGRSALYDWGQRIDGEPVLMLNSYELVRLGYVVVGGTYVMTWENWVRFAVTSPFRKVFRWRNHRFMVIQLIQTEEYGRAFSISAHPQYLNIQDPRLSCVEWWDIDSRDLT